MVCKLPCLWLKWQSVRGGILFSNFALVCFRTQGFRIIMLAAACVQYHEVKNVFMLFQTSDSSRSHAASYVHVYCPCTRYSLNSYFIISQEQLTCPSCKVKKKDAVLTKCFHVFCLECLKTRYETRQRKCPKCNAAFGANDYHRIYIS